MNSDSEFTVYRNKESIILLFSSKELDIKVTLPEADARKLLTKLANAINEKE